jgi:hypothetical protein
MAKLDNPAGRLYEVLNQVRRRTGNASIAEVWAGYFNISLKDTTAIYIHLVELMNLVDRAKKSVQQLQGVDHAIYLEPFKNIELALNYPNLSHQWGQVKSHLDNTTMLALKFCSDALSVRMGEKVISDEDLSKLQMEVETLLDKVLNANLPQDLAAVLTQKLEDIRQAILAYRITGNEGLRRAVESGFGAIWLHREEIQELQDEKQKETLLDILGFMAHLAQIGAFVLQAAQLTAPFIPLLGSGS